MTAHTVYGFFDNENLTNCDMERPSKALFLGANALEIWNIRKCFNTRTNIILVGEYSFWTYSNWINVINISIFWSWLLNTSIKITNRRAHPQAVDRAWSSLLAWFSNDSTDMEVQLRNQEGNRCNTVIFFPRETKIKRCDVWSPNFLCPRFSRRFSTDILGVLWTELLDFL